MMRKKSFLSKGNSIYRSLKVKEKHLKVKKKHHVQGIGKNIRMVKTQSTSDKIV